MGRFSAMMAMENCINRLQVRQHFSWHAREYDRFALVQQRVANRLSEFLFAQENSWERALEIGCGTGLLSRRVVRRFPDLPIVLSDLAHGMSQTTAELLPDKQICDADAESLPFRDNTFDLVLSSSVYQWVDDLQGAFGEVTRVLRPGGLFVLALFGEKTLYELRTSHQQALTAKPSHGQNFYSREQILQALGKSLMPFSLESEFEIEWHSSVPDLLRNLKKIGAQNSNRNRPAGLASRQVMQEMMAYYHREFGSPRGIPATYEVVYLLARRC